MYGCVSTCGTRNPRVQCIHRLSRDFLQMEVLTSIHRCVFTIYRRVKSVGKKKATNKLAAFQLVKNNFKVEPVGL